MDDLSKISLKLLLSLVIGVLFGIERDLKRVEANLKGEDSRFGGVRTFAIIGLLGGLCGYAGFLLNHPVYIYGFIAVAVFVIASYVIEHLKGGNLGMTTEFSALLTYTLGTLSMIGRIEIVIAVAIIALFLLSQKKTIEGWGAKIKPAELLASLKFALVLLVVFPFLKGIQPFIWQGITVFDPFHIWKMVVLVSGVSYLGYFLTRVFGQERGLVISGFLGGFASSTAVTHAMASQSRALDDNKSVRLSLIAATLFANTVSFLRALILVAILNMSFFKVVALPFGIMMVICLLPALFVSFITHRTQPAGKTEVGLESPFSLKPAFIFGLLFALVLLFVQLVRNYAGDVGLYFLSIVSGFPDLDAIIITLAGLAGTQVAMKVAAFSVVLGISSNLLFKTLIARMGGNYFSKWIGLTLITALIVGISLAAFLFLF